MTNIRATCPSCGEVDLTADDIDLRISNPEEGMYGFDCPSCIERVLKPADSRIIQLLLSGGVKAIMVEGPRSENDPPFTYDDILDFHMLLESDERMYEALEAQNGKVDGV